MKKEKKKEESKKDEFMKRLLELSEENKLLDDHLQAIIGERKRKLKESTEI